MPRGKVSLAKGRIPSLPWAVTVDFADSTPKPTLPQKQHIFFSSSALAPTRSPPTSRLRAAGDSRLAPPGSPPAPSPPRRRRRRRRGRPPRPSPGRGGAGSRRTSRRRRGVPSEAGWWLGGLVEWLGGLGGGLVGWWLGLVDWLIG